MSNVGTHDSKPRETSATHAAHRCSCGERALADCPGEWQQGCDLGSNPKHVKVRRMTPNEEAALNRSVFGTEKQPNTRGERTTTAEKTHE
jgi:hypothetical protein